MSQHETLVDAFTELSPRYEQVVNNELQRFWGWSYSGFIDRLLSVTEIHETDKILDIATGTCVIPRKLVSLSKTISPVTGLDLTYSMLRRGRQQNRTSSMDGSIHLTCANALSMPIASRTFDLAFCGLATHHMHVPSLLSEMHRVLRPGGRISIADAGGSPLWRNPIIHFFIRLLAYVYFLLTENPSRAWAESSAVGNVRTAQEWRDLLASLSFTEIRVLKMTTKHFWAPSPLLIQAVKP